MYLFFLEIGSIALAVAAAIFLILYVVEWRQRVKEEHQHDLEMRDIIMDYEHRMVQVEKDVDNEREWIKMLIQDNSLISEDIKNRLLSDFKARKGRVKMPHEENPAQSRK